MTERTRGWSRRGASRAAVFLLTSAFFLRGIFLALALPYGDPLDEPFHYGYASYLATTGLVPRAGVASMPADALRPMARLPRSTSFGGPHPSWKDFASEAPRERAADREEAFAFRPGERAAFVTTNYETQQPPLAYLPAAGILRLFPRAALDLRLALLRLFSALAAASAVPLVWLFFRRLLARGPALAATAAFVAFPGVGSFVGRFSNDGVALPIAAGLLCLFADAARGSLSRGKTVALAALLAAGCWTKLYFLLLLPVAPLAALLTARGRRAGVWKRCLAACACAFLIFLPWLVHQKSDSGDWLGLSSSTQATALGIGLLDRLKVLPEIFTWRFAIVFGRTFLWPGTWSASGAPAALAVGLIAVLLLLALVPKMSRDLLSRRREAAWRAGGVAVALFLLGQCTQAATYAAVGKVRGRPPSAGPDGWYLLLLFPVILTAACALGGRAGKGLFLAAAAAFLAGEWWLTFGVLPGVYGGATGFNGANYPPRAYAAYLFSPGDALRVFEEVGLVAGSHRTLLAVLALWLLSLFCGALPALRSRPMRSV